MASRSRNLWDVQDLLITQLKPGVVVAKTTDPFSSFQVHRVERHAYREAPAEPGIYVLYGFVDGEPVAYVGMSTKSIRDRITQHHVNPKKNWFGTLFAVPLQTTMHCPAIEAELIRRVTEAGVVSVVDNLSTEERFLDADDVHLAPALNAITGALALLLGTDIFTPDTEDEGGAQTVQSKSERVPTLARVYRGAASKPRERRAGEPVEATHAWVGAGISAWGKFEAPEPDTRFTVLKGSHFRRPVLDESHATYRRQQIVDEMQRSLMVDGVLDMDSGEFARGHTFENWYYASIVVSGKGQYSGSHHWQLLTP